MSLKYETPKTFTATDMFIWWCKEKIRVKRYLKIQGIKSHGMVTRLISRNGDELKWLREHVLVLAEQIEKLEIIDTNKHGFTKITHEIYDKKRELYNSGQRIKQLEQVDFNTEKIIMTENGFREILYEYNNKVRKALVEDAAVINMKQFLGYLYIQKIDRNICVGPNGNPKSLRMPNWGESNKYKQELIDEGVQIKDKEHPDGTSWVVYYDDDYYFRYAWAKKRGACRVKNHPYYSFIPSNGVNSSKKELIEANRNNPFLHKTYTDNRIYYNAPNKEKK